MSFDVCGPLPSGVTVLEASAGTGKTYTIAALAARYVAAGTSLDQLLLVTFTRMATGELRERVRERLVDVEHGLSRALAGVPGGDAVVELLATGSPDEVRQRRRRLGRALADFDAATIATTHGFCQEVLGGLGIGGDLDRDVRFVEDIGDLTREVVDDLYVRRFHRGDTPPFRRAEAAEIARIAVANPSAPIVPAVGEVGQMRRRLALAVRAELEQRKRRLGIVTYDDLLTRLEVALSGDGGEATAARLRRRYRVVLVDEFQDTDPAQWDIVRRAFGGPGGVALVLVGDPKQAIYAFRGADVYAYLAAARAAASQATLDVNWRSDQGLIDAYDTLFAGAQLGHPGIVYRRVRAAAANRSSRLHGPPHAAPLRIRVVRREDVAQTRGGYAALAAAREHVAADLAADVVRLLASGAEIESRSQLGEPTGRRLVRPGHVAVLVATNRSAAQIRDALEALDVPAVISGAGSVFATRPAGEWLRLLEAIERPASTTRARAAALTCFFGWSAARVAGAGELAWEQVHRRLHDWARVLRARGVASLAETITLTERLPERILASDDGERRFTDLRHVAQLLHAAATTEQLGTTAMTGWLRRRIAEAAQDTSDEERSRRLESDAEAVQVLTIHRSKGLEFPVVYAPFLWEARYVPREPQPVFFHDPDAGDARTVDVSLEGADFMRHTRQSLVEQRGEDLRLAYVALTRAQHQAVIWWAGSWDSRNSPLGRLLFARDADGSVASEGLATPTDDEAVACFEALAGRAPGRIAVERSRLGMPAAWAGPPPPGTALAAAVFGRTLDWQWRRTSYSAITAGAYEVARVASEPEQPVIVDEPPESGAPATGGGAESPVAALAAASLLGEMPGGVHVGTLVHRVLEAADFAAADLDRELATQLAAAQARGRVELGPRTAVVAGLRAALETPLGRLVDDRRLCDVDRADRLDELDFELPLAGGDTPTGQVTLAAIGDVLRAYLADDDPLAGYADRLGDAALQQDVRGYLTGSLDLVVRLPGPRFAIVDYKTNRLAAPGEELTSWHYRPEAVVAEMHRSHYALQALLYTTALHRYLRWRLPTYQADRDIAGVAYLFLRGMSGPATPVVDGRPCGVFAWQPPGGLVAALSDALDAGREPAG